MRRITVVGAALLVATLGSLSLAAGSSDRSSARKVSALIERGDNAFNNGEILKAEPLYAKALELRPRHAPALLRLALCHFELSEYQEALRFAEQAAGIAPTAQTHAIIGQSAMRLRQYDRALAAFQAARREDPDYPGLEKEIAAVQRRMAERAAAGEGRRP
jgi:tetratricopeptide (TPR) repeat protein